MLVMTKADFARRIGVSDTRISQMIRERIIGPDALEGEGRGARIRVELAEAQIAERRHPGQALGNGLETKVAESAPVPSSEPGAAPDGSLARLLQEERLEAEKRRNRIAARDEALALGQLVSAEDMRAEMGRLAQAIEDENAGMLVDFATAIAGQFGLDQRDLLHLLRKVRNEKKAQAAERARTRATELPATAETELV